MCKNIVIHVQCLKSGLKFTGRGTLLNSLHVFLSFVVITKLIAKLSSSVNLEMKRFKICLCILA